MRESVRDREINLNTCRGELAVVDVDQDLGNELLHIPEGRAPTHAHTQREWSGKMRDGRRGPRASR